MSNGTATTNAVIECILSRSAAKYYDPDATLTDDQIRELVRTAPARRRPFTCRTGASSPCARAKRRRA